MTVKIVSVFGTRPEAIKMAPLVKALEQSPQFSSHVAVTAQHREMLDQVLELFNIQPGHDLDIMKSRQTLSEITSNVLLKMGDVIAELNPHMLLVHGDTTTTFTAALAAYYKQVPIGHVEAGLRTGDKYAPYPEEMNRKLVGSLADLHFAPTDKARQNLLQEGVCSSKIFVTGNTVVDALKTSVEPNYQFHDDNLRTVFSNLASKDRVITLEVHRRENWGTPIRDIFKAVRKIVEDFPQVKVVFPVHRNPEVREPAHDMLRDHPRIFLVDPLDTRDFHNLISRSYLILTDSGGIQEEAPSFGVPVLVLRDRTEREEGLIQGTVILTGRDAQMVYGDTRKLLLDKDLYTTMRDRGNPYGDGEASARIVSAIAYYFDKCSQPPLDYRPQAVQKKPLMEL